MASTLFGSIKELGGSGTNIEIDERTKKVLGLTEAHEVITYNNSRVGTLNDRLSWARTDLKRIGAIENSLRGIWSITDHGNTLSEDEIEAEIKL